MNADMKWLDNPEVFKVNPVSYTHLDVYKRQAAEGAIGIAEKANKVRQKPLRVILNGLGKDAAQIISRISGFTFVETQYDYCLLYTSKRGYMPT